MKILSKIKALFRYRNQDAELEVSAAEIRNGKVFLHPADNKEQVYCIKSNVVDIVINSLENITEDDLEIINVKDSNRISSIKQTPEESTVKEKFSTNHNGHIGSNTRNQSYSNFMPKMKKVSFSVYPEEYDMLMKSIHESGYKKTEFLLGCVSAAKKNSMEATCRRYTIEHKARRKADKEAALLAWEQNQETSQQLVQ